MKSKNTDIAIIGAGIAGCTAAFQLARKGFHCTLIDAGHCLACEASSVFQASVIPFFSPSSQQKSDFFSASWNSFQKLLEQADAFDLWNQSGAVHLPASSRVKKILNDQALLNANSEIVKRVSKDDSQDVFGVSYDQDFLYYPHAGHLSPSLLCQRLVEKKVGKIKTLFDTEITQIQKNGLEYQLFDQHASQILNCSSVVIASAYKASSLFPERFKLEPVRGQLLYVKADQKSKKMKTVVNFGGYIIPEHKGLHVIGSTHEHGRMDLKEDAALDEKIVEKLIKYLPTVFEEPLIVEKRWVNFRTNTPSRLPYIENDEGIFFSIGHGARGIMSSCFAANLLTQKINQP